MRRSFALVVAFVLLTGLEPFSARALPDNGTWSGTLSFAGQNLRLVLHLSRDADGAWQGSMDSLDQGAYGIPLSSISVDADTLAFAIAAIGGSYRGVIEAAGERIVGNWSQGGAALPLEFESSATSSTPMPARPQTPQKPFPYRSEDVTFAGGTGVTLAGTITAPLDDARHPAVVLVSGSGPQDRNSEVFGHRPFLVLADYLTRNGFIVLRYDERGVGASTGHFEMSTTADFADDAAGAVAFLRQRKDVRRECVGVIGHSEGGYVAPMVAARKSTGVAFIVMLAGAGIPFDELLTHQARLLAEAGGVDPALIELGAHLQRDAFDIVRSEPDSARAATRLYAAADSMLTQMNPAIRDATRASMYANVEAANSRWFRFLISYDQAATLKQVRVPVLAVWGEKDLQVPPAENRPAVEAALRGGGNERIECVVFPGLNHMLQTAKTGGVGEYGTIEETIAPVVLDKLVAWLSGVPCR